MSESLKQEVVVGVIKGSVGAIPVVGSLLNEVLFDIRGRVKQDRFNQLVKEIEERLSKIEKSKVSERLIKSEEFGDIFEKIIKESTNKKLEENLKILAGIAVECMTEIEVLEHPLLFQIIDAVASLNLSELQILKHLIPYNKRNQEYIVEGKKEIDFQLDLAQKQILGLEKDIFLASFDSLISKGLVYDDSVGRWNTQPRNFIKPSQLGIELFKIIEKIKI